MLFDECYIKSLIRPVDDWPRKGIIFRDIAPLLADPRGLRMVADSFVQRYVDSDCTHIAAIDARGFPVASIVAYALQLPLVMVRKQGKLPPPVIHQDFDMEYGHTALEIQQECCQPEARVLIMDDLIATGHTMLATHSMLRKLGASVVEIAAIIDLPDLQGTALLADAGIPVYTLCAFAG